MRPQVIIDTGTLVAALNRRDQYHTWIMQQLPTFQPPFLTCEAVISETCFLLHHAEEQVNAIFEAPFHFDDESPHIATLMRKYADVPCRLQTPVWCAWRN
jgi:uncharacterized protein